MARRHRRPRRSPVQVFDHLPDRALRADHPRRLRFPAALSDHRAHQSAIDALWDYEDPAASEARFTAAADAAEGLERDVLLTQVARARGLQGNFDSALELLSSLSSNDSELQDRTLLERGRILSSSGQPSEAKRLFESAFEAASGAGLEFLAVDALHMLAIVAPAEEQDALNWRALELATSASDPRARLWRASLLNNMGWTAFDGGDLDRALHQFEQALEARLEHGSESEIVVARWCIARTLRELGRADEALAIQLELADELRAAGKTDPYVDEELAALQTSTTPDPGSA